FKGEIDAVEWNNPYDDETMGLPEAAPYCYYPGWWEPGATYELQIDRRLWEQLPVEYQEILKVAATNANVTMLAEYNARNGKVVERLIQSSTEFIPFSGEIVQAAYRKTFELYEEYASNDPVFRRVYENWNTFRTQVYRWNQINELSFINFMVGTARGS
ncbi:ABC transporter substrate-binding protein, partial [Oscillatoriales cyanobacterium LEGE 11467]|nr:ABC transporter substrate-binding protein [Zarconia navalis LEGE 11467]